MGRAVGIDLGTTNSVMAVKKREVEIIKNERGELSTRSAVSLYRNELIIGSQAVDIMASAYKDTILSIKRLMGRSYADKEVQEWAKRCTYEIKAPKDGTEKDIRVIIGGREYSPIEVSSLILKKMKADGESKARLGEPIDQAVITVPAYFVDKQRNATRAAGQMAGLKVLKILDEPTAAAIAFGVDNVGPDEFKTILVYDLGGGTFDVSLLSIAGGAFPQLNIEGDMWLGGDDFDYKIMDYVLAEVTRAHSVDASTNLRFMVELKKQAERAKIALSTMNNTEIVIMGLLKDKKENLIDVSISLSRTQFESMIQPEIDRSISLVKKAIEGANMTYEMVDHILLVGGSSLIPMVRRALADTFGEEKILHNIDPMTCVAQGAAILAQRLDGQVECENGHVNSVEQQVCSVCGAPLVIVEVGGITPIPYGIGTLGDIYEIIIEKGSPYPSLEPYTRSFITPEANMRRIRVPVYAGYNSVASENEPQVTAWLELPPNIKKETEVDVTFSLDENGEFKAVTVRLKDGSGREVTVFPDRGDGWRSKLEEDLNGLNEQRIIHINDMDSSQEDKFEKTYSRVVEAANKADRSEAEKHLQELQKLMGEIAKTGRGPVAEAELTARILDTLLFHFNYAMDQGKEQKIKALVEKAEAAVKSGSEKRCADLQQELDDELHELEKSIGFLIEMLICSYSAKGNGQKSLGDEIDVKLREFRSYYESNMGPDVQRVRKQLEELAEQVQMDIPSRIPAEMLATSR